MLDINTSQLSTFTFTPAAALEIQGPPPMVSSSTDPTSSAVMSMLQAMGSQLSQISEGMSSLASRVNHLEHPPKDATSKTAPYSPSIPAALWQPNPTNIQHATPYDDQGHELPSFP